MAGVVYTITPSTNGYHKASHGATAPAPYLANPEAVIPRLIPNGQGRIVFFAGKGGVGKTVASCTTAVWLAHQGYKTLLLTTDPAAHLGDVLGTPVGNELAPVAGVVRLWAAAYKKRILEDARQRGRSETAIQLMAEELESPCTEEIVAFDQFIEYAASNTWDVPRNPVLGKRAAHLRV